MHITLDYTRLISRARSDRLKSETHLLSFDVQINPILALFPEPVNFEGLYLFQTISIVYAYFKPA